MYNYSIKINDLVRDSFEIKIKTSKTEIQSKTDHIFCGHSPVNRLGFDSKKKIDNECSPLFIEKNQKIASKKKNINLSSDIIYFRMLSKGTFQVVNNSKEIQHLQFIQKESQKGNIRVFDLASHVIYLKKGDQFDPSALSFHHTVPSVFKKQFMDLNIGKAAQVVLDADDFHQLNQKIFMHLETVKINMKNDSKKSADNPTASKDAVQLERRDNLKASPLPVQNKDNKKEKHSIFESVVLVQNIIEQNMILADRDYERKKEKLEKEKTANALRVQSDVIQEKEFEKKINNQEI